MPEKMDTHSNFRQFVPFVIIRSLFNRLFENQMQGL